MKYFCHAKEVRRKAGSIGIPLTCLLQIANINRTSFRRWIEGYTVPTEANMEKLQEVLAQLDSLQAIKEKRGSEQ